MLLRLRTGGQVVLRRAWYYVVVVCTAPCLLLAVPIIIFEVVFLDTGGAAGQVLARPFLWACDRALER
jgi:hypothetical protein